MENLVYLFTSFISCMVVVGLLFQFMDDRYEKLKNGRPVRESGIRGGIGLLNVEQCVEKYGGSVIYRNEKNRFYCDILLNK